MIARSGIRVLAWLLGSLAAYVLASIVHTQTVLGALQALGVSISLGERLAMSLGDLAGLWRYGAVIALGMAIGLTVMSLPPVRRMLPCATLRGMLAGGLAMATLLASMKLAFSFTPIASARSGAGFALQCSAGAVGGLVYAHLCARWILQRSPLPESRDAPLMRN